MSWVQTDEFLLMIREFVTVEPLSYETHDLGIALARKHALSVYDAMIVAAGLLAGCDTVRLKTCRMDLRWPTGSPSGIHSLHDLALVTNNDGLH